MHKCIYKSRIEENEKKDLVMIVNAKWKDKTLDVLREDENGKQEARNLVLANIFGYGVVFPDEKPYLTSFYGNYYSGFSKGYYGLDEWGESCVSSDSSLFFTGAPSKEDLKIVKDKYPRFKKEVLKFCTPLNNGQLIKMIRKWKEEPLFKDVIKTGAIKIALGKKIYKSEKLRNTLALFAKEGKVKWYTSIKDLMSNIDYKEEFIKKNEEFKYVLQKWQPKTKKECKKAFSIWKNHREAEFLLAKGFVNLALDDRTYEMNVEKKIFADIVMNWIEDKDATCKDVESLNKIHDLIRKGMNKKRVWEIAHNYYTGYLSRDMFKYLINNDVPVYRYRMYTEKLADSGRNLNDRYWTCPKNFKVAYDKVEEELEIIRELKEQEKNRIINEKFYSLYKDCEKKELNGYSIYMASTVDDVIEQAESLHQCLVKCNYIKKCVDREIGGLIFVKKGSERVATAEIKRDGKIGQFYADEIDRNNCLPTEEVRQVVDSYILSVSPQFKKMNLIAA